MSGLLRNAVSKEKRRYKEDGFDLDLSYVGDRIIAMGFPSEKVEGIYRNPMNQVLKFLDTKHKDHYKVYNLCSERAYDTQKFYNRVGYFPFDDHNAPPFGLILDFCRDVENWLAAHEKNIAVIHCKAGKGRTGLMICAWLIYNKDWKNAEDAMKYYALARTNNLKGVTIPSQIRYIRYFHESLETLGWENPTFEPKLIILNKIIFHTLPKTGNINDMNFIVEMNKTTVFNYKDHIDKLKLKDEPKVVRVDKKKKGKGKGKEEEGSGEAGEEEEETATFDVGILPVCGDVRVDFEIKGARMFQLWFNTFFVKPAQNLPGQLSVSIPKIGLDKAFKDMKNHKLYDEKFNVELVFTEIDQAPGKSKSQIFTANHTNNNNEASSSGSAGNANANGTEAHAVQEPAQPAQEHAQPAQEPAQPAQEPSQPAREPWQAAQPAQEPAQEPAQPAQEHTQPAQEPAQPTQEPTQPAQDPAHEAKSEVAAEPTSDASH